MNFQSFDFPKFIWATFLSLFLQKKLVILQKYISFVSENQLNGSHNVE